MKQSVVLIGMGELGSVFARGLLRLGHPVFPILRNGDPVTEEASMALVPALVLVAVAETDLHPILSRLPVNWSTKVGLLQNELLPRDWHTHRIINPTVISVWFEKKRGHDTHVLLPSPAYGPHAGLLVDALKTIGIPAFIITDSNQFLYELVRKNLYILTTNIAGLAVGGTVDRLWQSHASLAQGLADEILDVQEWLTGTRLPREKLIAGMLEACRADPNHQCLGRTALARLQRLLSYAGAAGLPIPRLQEIATLAQSKKTENETVNA